MSFILSVDFVSLLTTLSSISLENFSRESNSFTFTSKYFAFLDDLLEASWIIITFNLFMRVLLVHILCSLFGWAKLFNLFLVKFIFFHFQILESLLIRQCHQNYYLNFHYYPTITFIIKLVLILPNNLKPLLELLHQS